MPNHVTNILEFTGIPAEIHHMMRDIQYDDGDYGSIDFNKIINKPKSLNVTSGGLQTVAVSAYLSAINPDNEDAGIDKVPKKEYNPLKKQIFAYFHHERDLTDKMTYAEIIKQSTEYFERPEYRGEVSIDEHNLFLYGQMVVDNIIKYGCADWYEWCRKYWGTKWNSYNNFPQDADSTEIIFDTAWCAPHPVIQELARKYPNIGITHKWADEDWGQNTGYSKYNIEGETTDQPCYLDGQEALTFAADILGINIDDFYTEHDCLVNVEEDFPDSISHEQFSEWMNKGFDFSLFPIEETTKIGEEYNLANLSIQEKKNFLEEMYRCKLSIEEFLYI